MRRHPFATYDAYKERYRLYWSEEGDHRPPLMSEEQFSNKFKLLRESYGTYRDLLNQGQEEEAAMYYMNVINFLENELAVADGTDNFLQHGNSTWHGL
ncbi:hypothetical protein SAMN05444487_101356 [Marininema mesophilum]|uniref:Uncharacterized protein n=1 Tax=Marininema mesophilum TaxID=1048340 RepID=A0A1H2R1F9_9BACL|nr:hypothetical protein [Marininema mesophilum]SDW13211.1 hypothetical protein SAMN05444487_101356 [Marininema mesophilum]